MADQQEMLARKVSERYWSTDETVNGIAEEMGISKARLYELIRPLAVEGSCPSCGSGPPVHPNRTALNRGDVECLQCGWSGALTDLSPEPPEEGRERPAHSVTEIEDGAQPIPFPSAPRFMAGVLVGLAAGILIGIRMRG